MYKEINRAVLAALLAFGLAACSDSEKKSAAELVALSQHAIENKDYSKALELIDTLNVRYPKQTEIRRDAMRMRAMAMEGIAADSIGVVDAELARATLEREEWNKKFRHVDSSVGLEGYFLPVGVNEKMMTANGIQGRVSDTGFFYLVANVQGRAIGLRAVELCLGADRVSSARISPERVISVEGSESASFSPEDLEALGPWLLTHSVPDKAVLVGAKSSVTVKLSAKQAAELVDCYKYSMALQAQRRASIRREKFERMLATARDQLANMPQKSEGDE